MWCAAVALLDYMYVVFVVGYIFTIGTIWDTAHLHHRCRRRGVFPNNTRLSLASRRRRAFSASVSGCGILGCRCSMCCFSRSSLAELRRRSSYLPREEEQDDDDDDDDDDVSVEWSTEHWHAHVCMCLFVVPCSTFAHASSNNQEHPTNIFDDSSTLEISRTSSA